MIEIHEDFNEKTKQNYTYTLNSDINAKHWSEETEGFNTPKEVINRCVTNEKMW